MVVTAERRSFPRKSWQLFLPKGEVGALSCCPVVNSEFLKSLFELRLKSGVGDGNQRRNSLCECGTNLWKSSLLNCVLSQPHCRKGGVFLKVLVGWELDQNSMEWTCKSFCCPFSGALHEHP